MFNLHRLAASFLAPRPDKLTLDIAIAEDEVDAYVLAVLDKRLDKAHVQELQDLKTLTSQCSVGDAGLPASVRVLCEQREIAAELLGGEVGATLAAHAELFEQIHFSDFVPAAWGLFPRVALELLRSQQGTLHASAIEIYQDSAYDLLQDRAPLTVGTKSAGRQVSLSLSLSNSHAQLPPRPLGYPCAPTHSCRAGRSAAGRRS